jgi:two-component system nitrogen regulation response regulator GlnG
VKVLENRRVERDPEATEQRESPLGNRIKAVPLKLVVVAGPDTGLEHPFDGAVEIGSETGADLQLNDRSVSRRHVLMTPALGVVSVKDLGSRNGTFLQGARIEKADVPIGAVLQIGETQLSIQPRWAVREIAPSEKREFGSLVGESVGMREVFAILERVAATDVPVLIEGESGTGKELAAKSLHAHSRRANGPYVVFDCASIPHELAESELFGHKKGAFTGATDSRQGAFTRADGGTLCLDEMGEMPLELQPKLLRALETGEIRPVGEDTIRKVDVRLVVSTNRDLQAEVQRGRFRADLFYRLDVVKVRLPALRTRPEDIPLIAARILEGSLLPGAPIGGEKLTVLQAYGWPGNVRELRNVLLRGLALAGAGEKVPFSALQIDLGPAANAPATIGSEFPGVSHPMPFKEAKAQLLESFERAYVTTLLDRHKGSVQKSAEAAGLSRKHLYALMEQLGVTPG